MELRYATLSPTPDTVPKAIYFAARLTSVDYDYLLAQAELESSMDPNARAATSSATGLYQFINSTWISTFGRHARRFALDHYSQHIKQSVSGQYHVPDPQKRQEILNLRRDPRIASLMAGALAAENREQLVQSLRRMPEHPELYLAHFLGVNGAIRFLENLESRPWQNAATLFPAAARANARIFFERDRSPRSLAQVMDVIRSKYDRASNRVAFRFPVDAEYAHRLDASLGRKLRRGPYIIVNEAVFLLELPGRPSANPRTQTASL